MSNKKNNFDISEVSDLFTKALDDGLKANDIKISAKLRRDLKEKNTSKPGYQRIVILGTIIAVLLALRISKDAYNDPVKYLKGLGREVYSKDSQCLLTNHETTIEITRKPVECSICDGITTMPIYNNMTKDYFLKHHAYTGIPALIKGGAQKWSALKKFGYNYFKKIYDEEALDAFDDKECQFLGYKTNFQTLYHVFKMSKKRASLKKDQWYIGWSNCVEKVQSKLRKHYQRPDFLPDDSESSSLDWIFMGGSGTGASMHIDGVNRPSWQAMIKGMKTWYIQPPAECFMACPNAYFNATMEQGDILVIDTNKWFHSTFIHPVGLSITIGSEYD